MTVEEYKRAMDARYLPITIEEIEAIVTRHLVKPTPTGVRVCACLGAAPMIRGVVDEIKQKCGIR